MLPSADAMIVVPATFSTINKWAAGISDTLALGLINEAIGMSIPIVAVPHVNAPLARHPGPTPFAGRHSPARTRLRRVPPRRQIRAG